MAVRVAERFRDLEKAEARRERCARTTGLPLAAAGAWVAPSLLLDAGAAARLLLLTAPLIWAAASAASRRAHVEREPEPEHRLVRWTPLLFWSLGAVALVRLARATWYHPVPRLAALVVAAAALAAVLAGAHRLARRTIDASEGAVVMIPAVEAVQDSFDGELWGWLGLAFLALGAFRQGRLHWAESRVRSLRRRLGLT